MTERMTDLEFEAWAERGLGNAFAEALRARESEAGLLLKVDRLEAEVKLGHAVLDAAEELEREACARLIVSLASKVDNLVDADRGAAAIRARGEK